MKPENFKIDELIEYMQGTCKSMQEGLNELYPDMEEDDLTMDDWNDIENEIFNCSQCGWWCEISEESGVVDGELVCNDCAENEDED